MKDKTMAKSYVTRSRGNLSRRRGSSITKSANSSRRIVGRNNVNVSSSRNSSNLRNGNTKSHLIRGKGGRRINTSFDNLNRRKLATARNNKNNNSSFLQNPGNNRNNRSNSTRLNNTNSGAIRRGRGGFRGRGNSGGSRGRGGTSGSFRGNRRFQKGNKNTTTASLDAALDSYMGVDACKARLDSQLDSYFSGQSTGNNDGIITADSAMNMEPTQAPIMISL